ncbi:HD domain-containing protein [Clostridiales bacterium FE2011]|nr:HD domain-containing protein [Clostridiales bacterium FE2011]
MPTVTRNGAEFSKLAINERIMELDNAEGKALNDLDQFTELIRHRLDEKQWYAPIAYTPHDYSHHVIRVLQYGSKILSSSLDVFEIDDLLVFQYACLLHDIDMIYNPKARQIHSMEASLAINPYSDKQIEDAAQRCIRSLYAGINDLEDCQEISDVIKESLTQDIHNYLHIVLSFLLMDQSDYWEAIGQVVLGHSDIKLTNTRINTLEKEFYESHVIGVRSQEEIKTRVLAAVLRLADELDCSKHRKGGIDTRNFPPEAKDYWKKLDLIKQVKFEMPKIELQVNSAFIHDDKDKVDCYKLLHEIHEKIQKEYKTVKKCISDARININIEEPELVFDDPILKKNYDAYLSIANQGSVQDKKKDILAKDVQISIDRISDKQTIYVPADDINVGDIQKKEVYVSGESSNTQTNKLPKDPKSFYNELTQKIQESIKNNNLIYSVHRQIGNRGMRNHLDCNGLLADEEILDETAKAFVNYIYTHSFDKSPESIKQDKYFLVGIANSGVLLASRVAMITGLPMMYFIPSQKADSFSKQEEAWEEYAACYENRKPILIIGVNVTGKAVKDAQDFLKKILRKKNVFIEAVLGIVNRDVDGTNDMEGVFDSLRRRKTKVAFLHTGYPVDWCQYSENATPCPYNDQCGIDRKNKRKRVK